MKLTDLGMSYGQHTLFEHLNLEISQGLVLIKGESGCGKSTLLRLMMQDERPTQGTVNINESEKDYLYLGEGTFLLDYLSLRKNISFLLKKKMTKETEENAEKLFVRSLLDTPIKKLSSGERQKMELLFAMQSRHHTYYFDEPFSSMDKESRVTALELIQKKAKDTLCFLIAHEDMECDCDMKIRFEDGKVSVDSKSSISESSSFHNEKRNPFSLSVSYLLHKEKGNLIFQLFLLCSFLFTFFFGLSNLNILSMKEKKETVLSSYPFSYYQMKSTKQNIHDSFFDIEKECVIQYRMPFSKIGATFTFLSCLKDDEEPVYIPSSRSLLSEGEQLLINDRFFDINVISDMSDDIKQKLPDSYHYRMIKDEKTQEENLVLCSKSFLNLVLSSRVSFSRHPEIHDTKKTFEIFGTTIVNTDNENFSIDLESPWRLSVPGINKGTLISNPDDGFTTPFSFTTTEENKDGMLHVGINLYKKYLFYFFSKDEFYPDSALFSYILSKEQISLTITDDAFSFEDMDNLRSDDTLSIVFLSISGVLLLFLILFPVLIQRGLETFQTHLNSLLLSHNKKSCFSSYLIFYFSCITILLAIFYLLRSTLFLQLGDYNFMIKQYGSLKQEGYYYYSKQPLNDYFDSMVSPIRWQRMNRLDFLPLISYLLCFIYAYFFSKKPKKKK